MARLWRRKDRDVPQTAAPRELPSGAPAEQVDGVIRQERPSPGDWMTLPPLRTTGPIQPTFRVQTLPDILTSHHSPRVSGSMGHAISADGPSGVIDGLTLARSGAASAGPRASGDLTLRTPHPHPTQEDVAPLRPLPVATSEPLPVSRLPEPAVARATGDPLPLVSPASPGREMPVARVVDSAVGAGRPTPPIAIPAHAVAPVEVEPSPVRMPAPDAATSLAATDPRVGGFDLSALEPAVDPDAQELLTPRPEALAPPIQPRTLQRRAAGARPIEIPPHLQRSSEAPTPAATTPAGPSADTSAPSVPRAATAPLDLPLRHAPVAPATDTEHAESLPVQRDADGSAPTGSTTTTETSGGAPIAPLAGLTATGDATPGGPMRAVAGAAEAVAADEVLPLVVPRGGVVAAGDDAAVTVARLADGAATNDAAPSTDATGTAAGNTATERGQDDGLPETDATGGADEGGAPVAEAPTLGAADALTTLAGAEPLSSAGAASAASIGTPAGALPLAPSDWQETLDAPPTRTADIGETPQMSTIQRSAQLPSTAATTTTSAPSTRGPLPLAGSTRPVTATSSAMATLAATAPLMPSTTSVIQRAAAATAAATAAGGVAVGSRGALHQPLATRPAGTRSDVAVAMPLDLPDLVTPSTLALPAAGPAVPEARSDATDGAAGTPLPLQRSAAGNGEGGGGGGGSAMPLHSPAAAMPSAADIAVSAGLAERAPDGSLLFSRSPAASAVAMPQDLAIQRSPEAGDAVVSRALSEPDPGPSITSASAGPGTGGGEPTQQEQAQTLADQARKLYPHLRQQLESDIRRQLEARNRGDRFRP